MQQPLSERLSQICIMRHGGKQQAFADHIGVSKATMSQWLSGDRTPRDLVVRSICERERVSYTWLTTGEGEMDELPVSDLSDAIASLSAMALNDPDTIGQLVRVLARLGPEYLIEAHRLTQQYFAAWQADLEAQQKKE